MLAVNGGTGFSVGSQNVVLNGRRGVYYPEIYEGQTSRRKSSRGSQTQFDAFAAASRANGPESINGTAFQTDQPLGSNVNGTIAYQAAPPSSSLPMLCEPYQQLPAHHLTIEEMSWEQGMLDEVVDS